MKAVEWIDRVKAAKGWTSDYFAAQQLGITRGGMSNIRTGESLTLGEATALEVAKALGERPEAVLLDQYAERTKNPEVRSALARAARDLCILCKIPRAMALIADYLSKHGAGTAFC